MEMAKKANESKGLISKLRWRRFTKMKHEVLFYVKSYYSDSDFYKFFEALLETIAETPKSPYTLFFFENKKGSPLQNWAGENPERSRKVLSCIHNNTTFNDMDIRLNFWDASIFIR